MNKDRIAMLVLLVGTLLFFNSPAWHKLGSKIKAAPEKTEITDSTATGDTAVASESAVPALLSSTPKTADTPALPGESVVEENEVPAADTTEDSTDLAAIPAAIETTTISNNLLTLTVAGDGARIISAKVNGYRYAEKLNFGEDDVELLASKELGIAGSAIQGQSLNGVAFSYVGEDAGKHTFRGVFKGKEVEKSFLLTDSSYVVGYELNSELLDGKNSTILFSSGINESESKDGTSRKYSPRQIALFNGKKVEKLSFKGIEHRQETSQYDWVALTSQYFTVATLPSVVQESDVDMRSSQIVSAQKAKGNNILYSFAMTAPAAGTKANYSIYLGPNRIKELKSLEAGMEKIVFRGYGWFFGANLWFPKLCEFVLWLMNIFFFIFKDYGIAIILITIILRAVTFPLTNSSMKSMAKMRDIQPKLQAIQAKHKDNPQLMQAKLMEFYKEEGVNPLSGLGGCIPMILQMPIMISLFVVLRKAVELRGQDTFLLPWVNDLSQKEALFDLPFTVPVANIDTLALLPFAMGILMFFQNKMTMGKNQNANMSPEMAQQQRMMLYMMPLMMFFMFYNMPAGLTLYFTFSSVIQIVQQHFVDKAKKKNQSSVSVVK